MIDLIRHFVPKKFPFYILGDFKLPHIDCNIPSTTYNHCHKRFIKFCSDIILSQLIESPIHKDGNILDFQLCNYKGLDRVKFHLVYLPLIDHNVISFSISVDKSTKSTFETLYPNFYSANFENVNK